jgi:hypothetical protein
MGILSNKIDWSWLLWRVLIPLLAPVVVSSMVIFAWVTGSPSFKPYFGIALDVSPWALTFYSLTLVGSTLNEFWPRLGNNTALRTPRPRATSSA